MQTIDASRLDGTALPGTDAHRKRRKAIRTRSGCLTCRKRRKACDMGKPDCGACVRLKQVRTAYSLLQSLGSSADCDRIATGLLMFQLPTRERLQPRSNSHSPSFCVSRLRDRLPLHLPSSRLMDHYSTLSACSVTMAYRLPSQKSISLAIALATLFRTVLIRQDRAGVPIPCVPLWGLGYHWSLRITKQSIMRSRSLSA